MLYWFAVRKGIKIFANFLSASVLLLIILPLTASLLLSIPAVQQVAVGWATRYLSNYLETRVDIRRINISPTGRVHIDGLYIEDYQHDTLLYIGHIRAYITGFSGGVGLHYGHLKKVTMNLRETPEGVMNIKQVVERLQNPDRQRKGNFRLTMHSASIEDMNLRIERQKHRDPIYGIDYGNMRMHDLNAAVRTFTLEGPTISTQIDSLRVSEASGFDLRHLSGRFLLTASCLCFEEARLRTDRSNIYLPYFSLVGNEWAEYKDFISEVEMEGDLSETTVDMDDVAYFAPSLREWHTVFRNATGRVSGRVGNFHVALDQVETGRNTRLAAEVKMRGLPDIHRTWFDVRLTELRSNAGDAAHLCRAITRRPLPAKVETLVGRIGTVRLSGRFTGYLKEFTARLLARSEAGSVNCDLTMQAKRGRESLVSGNVKTDSFDLGRLLDNRELGDLKVSANINGHVGRHGADLDLAGDVSRLQFHRYDYDSLRFDGRLVNKSFFGVIKARDEHLDFDLNGNLDFNDEIPAYRLDLALHHADLAAIHINPRDSVSLLSAHLDVNASGRSLDDLNGTITLDDVDYRYNESRLRTGRIAVTGKNSAHDKNVRLTSDFANAHFQSKLSYRTVFDYLKRAAWRYLPLIGEGADSLAMRTMRQAAPTDFAKFSLRLDGFTPVADAILPGLQVADNTMFDLQFNPASDYISVRASSDYIEHDATLITRLKANLNNLRDSVTLYASTEDLYWGRLHLPNLSVQGGARNRRVEASMGFLDTTRRFACRLGGVADVAEEHGPNGRVVAVRLKASELRRGDNAWSIPPALIRIDTASVNIRRFTIENGQQQLLLRGIASRHATDSLTLTLRDFSIAPFSEITNLLGYHLDGRTNGTATMRSALGDGKLTADILLDSVTVNALPTRPMRLTSRWEVAESRIGLWITDRRQCDTLIRGFFSPRTKRYGARLVTDSINMALLDPILEGIISTTRGVAAANLVLRGERRDAQLRGTIDVRDLSTHVDYTQCDYRIPQARIEVENNRFAVRDAAIYDPEGRHGAFALDLNLNHLSNIGYDVRVNPEAMLVLNTTSRDNDLFYGKVYATGEARFTGNKGNNRIEVVARSDDGSRFSMPLSSKSNITYGDFVEFTRPANDEMDSLARKKWSFENRKRKKKITAANQLEVALDLDIRPNVDMDLDIAGNTLRGRGTGSVTMRILPAQNIFEMYGDYAISEGSFLLSLQQIINKRFTIAEGSSIQWTGSPMNAQLNIDALYRVKASLLPLLQGTASGRSSDRSTNVDCVIHLGDQLANPSISFDVRVPESDPETATIVANALSTPETRDTQFVYLLLFNSFLAENASSTTVSTTASSATGFELISNMVSNMLSTSGYNIMLNYRPESEFTSEEVDIGLSKSLVNDRLFVELEGNYLIDNKHAVHSGTMSNFMGEAYLTYLIDRAGTLKFKAFTQTIDRFDENQGLQETGIGLYYKEDFNNLKDLRDRILERFRNPKRQAKRQARRAEKQALKNEQTIPKNEINNNNKQ